MNQKCIICNSDTGNTSIICDKCIHPQNTIKRTELFTTILSTFRNTAQMGFDLLKITCKHLADSLEKIHLDFTPTIVFDEKVHSKCIDAVAQSYMQNKVWFNNFVPLSSEPDRNCLYHSIKLLMPTMTASVIELRVRVMIEVVNNYEIYTARYSNLNEICDELPIYCRELKDKEYSQIWDILGLCDVLKCRIRLTYAKDPWFDLAHLHPLQNMYSPIKNDPNIINTITLMWTNVLSEKDLLRGNKAFHTGHFVPLLMRTELRTKPDAEALENIRMEVLQSALNLIRNDTALITIIDEEIRSMTVSDDATLFAIFCASNMTGNCGVQQSNEKEILYLLLNYLLLKLENQNKIDRIEEIFSFTNEQRKRMNSICEKLKQWLVDLVLADSIKKSSAPTDKVKKYAIVLQEKISILSDVYIVPSGFFTASFSWTTSPNFLMLEPTYTGPHSSACIIESKDDKYKKLVCIDSISNYYRSYQELTKDMISLGLEIDKIPSKNFNFNFFQHLMTLRIIPNHGYHTSHLYEVILAKLGGEGFVKNEKESFVSMDEKGFLGLPWMIIKNVFWYLLHKYFEIQDARFLYFHIIYEFQFKLLITNFEKFSKLNFDEIRTCMKYQFLLHEMCNKVAYDMTKNQIVRKEMVINSILTMKQHINANYQKLYITDESTKCIQEIIFPHKNFEKYLLKDLKGPNFLQNVTWQNEQHFTLSPSGSSDLSNEEIRKQFSFRVITLTTDNIKEKIRELHQMLDQITSCYGFNRIIQVSQAIEDFVLSVAVLTGPQVWFGNKISDSDIAQALMHFAQLYYNCSAFLAIQLFSDQNYTYDPTHYTKLVIVLFSLFGMIEEMVRNDSKIGPSLNDYIISTAWNTISLESIVPQLALPGRKWLLLINKIKAHFKLSSTNNVESALAGGKCIFHYSLFSLSNNSHKNNANVIYALNVLKKYFPDHHRKLEEDFKKISLENQENRWWKLVYEDEYLPELLLYLRDIAHLSQLSLCGFSLQIINSVNSFSSLSRTSDIFKRKIIKTSEIHRLYLLSVSYDKNKLTDFTLPDKQNKYQKLMTFDYDEKYESRKLKVKSMTIENENSVFENTVISSQNEKPEDLTRPQYYRLCGIQRDDELKFTFLYIALKNKEINFEMEEHCYLVKRALQKPGVYNDICLLEKQFKNKNFAAEFVKVFIDITLDLKERITQYKSLGHAIDILLYLYDFCSDDAKLVLLIENCFEVLRCELLKYIRIQTVMSNVDDDQEILPVISSYYILTYNNPERLDKNQVLEILDLRIRIENYCNLYKHLSVHLYTKTMATLFKLSSKIENIINANLSMLNIFFNKTTGLWTSILNIFKENFIGSWKNHPITNVYVKEQYSFVPLKGRLYKNGLPLSVLPSRICNHPHYKECFGKQNFLADIIEENFNQKKVLSYRTRSQKYENIRVILLPNTKLWIECDNQVFVSKDYLRELPKCLHESTTHFENDKVIFYNHWYRNNVIFAKNQDSVVKFEIDLKNDEIYSKEHEKFLIPFAKDSGNKSNAFYATFARFEDENYILALKNEMQDGKPIMICLPRLNLKFKIEGTKILSEDFKDYRLSQNQCMNTLFGLSQYLIIEPDIRNNNQMRFNRKVVIANRPIKLNELFFSNIVEFDLSKIGRPAYFSYEIDENLEYLRSETTAGSLYLALLYFRTATLSTDLFFKMNGYETCVEILKTCWQNCPYSDIEFNIILRFFDTTAADSEKSWLNNTEYDKNKFSILIHGVKFCHRNTHAIFLRLIYLLLCSFQTDFLAKTDGNKTNLYHYMFEADFVKYHFNFYLIFKRSIDRRCRLSRNEEKKLLSVCVKRYSHWRLTSYYESLKEKKDLVLSSVKPIDYKRLQREFFSKENFQQINFTTKVQTFFNQTFSSQFSSLVNQNRTVQNVFNDWVQIQFGLSYFVAFYRIALNIGGNADWNQESFFYFLTCLFTHPHIDNSAKIFLRILYIVSIFPEKFRALPEFICSEKGDISSESYSFHTNSMQFLNSDITITSIDGNAKKNIETSIYEILKTKYLGKNAQSKFTVKEIECPEFKLKFQNDLEVILKQGQSLDNSGSLSAIIYKNFINKRKNKEFYEFFLDLLNVCDKIIGSNLSKIDYNVIETKDISVFNMISSREDVEKQINTDHLYVETNENCISNLEWRVKKINIKAHYQSLKNFFEIKSFYPDKIPFPLDFQDSSTASPARETFLRGYGKSFISDLRNSYGKQSTTVKIYGKYFSYIEKEPKEGITFLQQLGLNYIEALGYIKNNLNNFKSELVSDVDTWIKDEISNQYIPEKERQEISAMSTKLVDVCEKINSELINQNILVEPLMSEPLKQKLIDLKDNKTWKLKAKILLNTLSNTELEIEKFMFENNDVFKFYLEYCVTNKKISSTILKLICQNNKIGIIFYHKLDTSGFELTLVEDHDKANETWEKQYHLWLNGDMFCQIEIKEIEDTQMIETLENQPSITGYLQTLKEKFILKPMYDINDIVDLLARYYFEYQETNMQLFNEIRGNITLISNTFENTKLFVLHQIIGEKPLPTKKDILYLLKEIDKIIEWNPFIANQKDIFYEKIECYLVQETLIEQIRRVILLISQYKSLNCNNDKDERERILENIYTNILMERSYDTKVYPSWLLFEIENNLLVRDTQYALIKAMLADKDSTIYQLNMGEGKTSVILVILSEMLANDEQIVRINCLESLMGVMQELLRNKFSGLLRKKIYVMPFSRDVEFSQQNVEKIIQMLTDCQKGKHILLVTPEQRLCFQLKKQEMFLEYLQSKDADDFFSWQICRTKTYNYKKKQSSSDDITDSPYILKQALQSLGYINEKDKIMKVPSDESKFIDEVKKKNKTIPYAEISCAYQILRDQSKQLKNQRLQKLSLLSSIDEFQFFDILDESDEILRHGKELNYTLGVPKSLDGGLFRWEIPFSLFKIIFSDKGFAETLKNASNQNDCSVIFQENFRPVSGIGGGCPLIRFVDPKYFNESIKLGISQRVCEILRSKFCEKRIEIIDEKGEIYGTYEDFVNGKCISKEIEIIELLKRKSSDMLNNFLLAKAWLSHELLYHVMNYRYRVEYGLSEKEKKEIAIPFRGKDLPAENSEFSHPDIMIGFTILSYLYRGLDLKQVKDGLVKLKSDHEQDNVSLLRQFVEENKLWINEQIQKERESFPEWLTSFKTLDLEHEDKIKRIHIYLSRNFTFIQYYLSNFTFPNETKYYEKKLTGNAHTLAGEGKTKGFSGTDDRNDTMPESVVTTRLSSQIGTNGKMLHILSRKINKDYRSINVVDTKNFLSQVCEYVAKNKYYYILIDAGAIITEMSNIDVSKYIIEKIHERFDGVVFFSDKTNKIMVALINNEYVPLAACHIDNRRLFVYLDEIHTRGTDLKLPLTARGIVTLGKNMNKDKLMQAVMRLRDLDSNQSVEFWGTKEISAEIAIINGIEQNLITSRDVLTWVTYNTIRRNESDLYLATKEKLKYVIKSRALEYQKRLREIPMNSLITAYVSVSPDSIEASYGRTPQERNPRDMLNRNMGAYLTEFHPSIKTELEKDKKHSELIKEIDRHLNDVDRPKMECIIEKVYAKLPNNILTINSDVNSEQENEREIEEMRHVEISQVPKKQPIPESSWDFSKVFEKNFLEKAYQGESNYPQLKSLKDCFQFTDIEGLKALKWHGKIFVTQNFIKTIHGTSDKIGQYQNDYLKPVNMILVYRENKEVYFIVISIFEAQNILTLCHERNDPKVTLVHIDDVNGPTMIPLNARKMSEEEIHILTIIRLFNGDCHYDKEKIKIIKKCLAFLDKDQFHQDKQKSEEIYVELESKYYLVKGFMTQKLNDKLCDPNTRILPELETRLDINLQKQLLIITKNSIAEDVADVWRLPELIRQLIQIRGKTIQYARSGLKEILDANRELS